MGIQASNTYNVNIPIDAIAPIMDEYDAKDWQGNPLPRTAEGLVQLIADAYGNDFEAPEFFDEEDSIHIVGYSDGKLGDADNLAKVLARHGAEGIIHGEADGELFLQEFANGEARLHNGRITFPTYKGDRLG